MIVFTTNGASTAGKGPGSGSAWGFGAPDCGSGSQGLTRWTDCGASPGGDETHELGPAARAWFSGASVDAMGFLKSARLISSAAVVADGGTAGADCGVKNASNSAVEQSSAVLGDGGGTAQRVDAGREKRFVAIDVSHPCEDVLVH